MNIRTLSLIVVALIALQMLIVWVITAANKDLFHRPAVGYPKAVQDLSARNPFAGFVLKGCYLASIVEVALVAFVKYL